MAVPSNIVTLAAESADVITDVTEEGNSGVDEVNDLPEADTSDDELEVIGIEEVEENTVPEDAAVQAEDVQAAVQSAAVAMPLADEGVDAQAANTFAYEWTDKTSNPKVLKVLDGGKVAYSELYNILIAGGYKEPDKYVIWGYYMVDDVEFSSITTYNKLELKNNEEHSVAYGKATEKLGTVVKKYDYVSENPFKVKLYHDLTVSIAEGSAYNPEFSKFKVVTASNNELPLSTDGTIELMEDDIAATESVILKVPVVEDATAKVIVGGKEVDKLSSYSTDANYTYYNIGTNSESRSVSVEYLKDTYTINLEIEGKGSVQIGEQTYTASANNLTMTGSSVSAIATPNSDEGYYVDSITVTGSNADVTYDCNVATATFSTEKDGNYTVTVTFTELTFPQLSKLTVGLNPKNVKTSLGVSYFDDAYIAEIESAIKTEIVNAFKEKNIIITADAITINLYGTATGWIEGAERYDKFSTFFNASFGTEIRANANNSSKCNATETELLKITWDASKVDSKYPTISTEGVELTVYDSRSDAKFKNITAGDYTFVNNSELITYVETQLQAVHEAGETFTPNITYKNDEDVTIELTGGTIPSFDESNTTSAELTYTVTYAGDSTYKPATATVKFTATCKAAQCTVAEAESNNSSAGTVTFNGNSGETAVDGLSEVTVVVAPKDGYAVETITVTADNNETVTVSNIIYECDTKGNRTASAKFTTGGKSGAVTYTVAVTYSEISMKLKSDQYLTYCYENDTDITANKMGSIVFAQIFESASGYDKAKADIKVEYNYLENYLENEDISNTIKNWVSTLLAPYQELTGTDGSLSVTKTIEIPILGDWTLTNYHFGEYGTEKIRLTVDTKNPKYGSYTGEVQLTVYDSCYNNTIKGVDASAITSELEVNTKKDASGTEKYKQNTAYTITVTPDNGREAYPSEIQYVKDIIVTDFEGKKVEGTLKHNKATDLIEGVTITKANSTFTFTTGSNEIYTVKVVYGRLKMRVTDNAVTVKMYEGKTLTAAELIESADASIVSVDADNEETAFEADMKITYSILGAGLVFTNLENLTTALLDLENGENVTFRFEYAGDDQHHAMGITKTITLKDTRTATEIKYTALAENAVLDYVNHTKFEAELKAKLNAYVAAGDDELQQDYEFKATAPAADTEEGKLYSTVTISYKGNDDYKPAKDVVFKVEVKEIPDDASVTVTGDAEKGTVTASGLVQGTIRSQETVDKNTAKYTVLGENAYVFTVVPKSGYAVESIDVYQITEKDSAENEEEVSTAAQNTENTVETPVSAEVTYKDQTASVQVTLKELCNYIVKVTYVSAEFDFAEDAQYKFRIGIDTATVDDLYKEVVKAPGINTDEDGKFESFVEGSDRKVEYLARPTGTKLVITLPKIEFLGVTIYKGGDIEVSDLGELWLDPSEEVPVVTSEQITNEIMADLEEMMESIKDISDIGKLTKYMASINSKISSYAKYYGAHAFGAQETETLRVSYEDAKWLITEQQTKVTIVDPRIATTLQASAATVTYGATAAELLKAMNASILDPDGNKVDGTIEFITDLTTLNASETPYDVVIKFNGNEDYRPSETLTVQVTVNKAPCKLDITSPKSVVYGTDYDLTFATDPAGVEMIQFAVGLDVAEAAGETGATGFVQIVIPGDLGKILEGLVGDTELSLEEFVKILEGIVGLNDSILAGIGFDETTVEIIRTILEAVSDYMDAIPALRIKIGGELKPSNIGVYLVGAVTADSNYETAFDVDYLIITSKLEKFELEWDYDDANGIITNQSTKEEWFSLGAHAKEGTLESGSYDTPNKKIAYLFLGVDKEGKFVFKDSSDGLGVGGYTQVAYTKDFGNTMYIAAPIARAFAIVPNIAKVSVGDDNHASLVTFDGQQHAMDVTVTTEAGTPITDLTPLTVTYVGYDANDVKIYNSTTPPTNAGTYTVYAVYADKEGEHFGAGMGVLVIAPAESSVTVDDIVTTVEAYKKNFGAVVTPEDCKYITVLAGISLEEDQVTVLNIDLPERLEKLLKQYAPNMLNGISLNELLKATDSIKEKLTELGLDAAFIDEVINIIDQIPVTGLGDVKVTFKDYAEVAPTTAGIYVLGAVTCDPNYKLVADTGILVLDPLVQVNFIDENGEVNHDRKFTYDGKSKAMDVKVTNKDGEKLANYHKQYLTVTYVGYTTAGEKYNSTEAPTEAGAYAVTAVYKNTEDTLYGMAVGAMTILPAESELTVTDQTIVYGTDYALSTMIETDPSELTYLTALAKVTDDSVLEVILPTELETTFKKVLEKTGLENITYEDLLAKAEELKTYVENLNLDSELVDQILAFAEEVLDKADKATSIKFTFADLTNAATLTVGKYAVGAISTSTNHKVSADLGWLTVTPREIIVTVAPDSKTYGDVDPTFTATAAVAPVNTGLVNGDKLASASVTREEGETVGTYQFSIAEDGFQVTAADGTEDRTYCYTMKIADNNVFTINKKDVTVIIDCKSKVYGEADPEFTYTAVGLVDEDTLDITLSREEGENVGEYAITATVTQSEKNKNYDVTIANDPAAVLAITPATISEVTVDVTAPVADADVQKTITVPNDAGYTAEISWVVKDEDGNEKTESGEKYAYDTVYTAKVILTSDQNHVFANNISFDNFDSKVYDEESGTYTLTKKFDATTKKICTVNIESPLEAWVTDEEGNPLENNQVEAGTIVKIGTSTKDGFIFKGWAVKGSETEIFSKERETVYIVTNSVTLVAVYDQVGLRKLVVSGDKGSYSVDDKQQFTNNFTKYYTANTEVTVNAVDENQEFLYWVNDDEKIMYTGREYPLTLSYDMDLTAVYKNTTSGYAVVEYVSYYKQVMHAATYTSSDEHIAVPEGPNRAGMKFERWSLTEEEILRRIADGETYIRVTPIYETTGTCEVTINAMDNVSEPVEIAKGSTYTFIAQEYEDYKFSHWSTDSEGKKILSYRASYTMTIVDDTVIYANYVGINETVEALPVIAMTDIYIADESLVFIYNRSVPEGYTVEHAGMIVSTNLDYAEESRKDKFVLNGANDILKREESEDHNIVEDCSYTLSISVNGKYDKKVCVRGYLILKDTTTNDLLPTIYTDVYCESYNTLRNK